VAFVWGPDRGNSSPGSWWVPLAWPHFSHARLICSVIILDYQKCCKVARIQKFQPVSGHLASFTRQAQVGYSPVFECLECSKFKMYTLCMKCKTACMRKMFAYRYFKNHFWTFLMRSRPNTRNVPVAHFPPRAFTIARNCAHIPSASNASGMPTTCIYVLSYVRLFEVAHMRTAYCFFTVYIF